MTRRSSVRVVALIVIAVAALIGALGAARLPQNRNSRAILNEEPPPFDHRIAYGSDPLEFGELRLPRASGTKKPYPVVVVFHGGCWLAQYGLAYMGHLSADLTQSGIATWNVEYRRIGDNGGSWPGTFDDAARSVEYLRVLAKSYPIDLKRVILVGHSAGGHLALWVAGRRNLSPRSPLYAKDPLPLAGIVSLAGITDLRRKGTACDAQVQQLMHGAADQEGISYDLASPMALLPLGVRQTIIQGDRDGIIPTAMATSYIETAKRKGDDPRLVVVEKAGHFELVDPKSFAWAQVKAEILALLK
jgi:acetyl esterase/lipase